MRNERASQYMIRSVGLQRQKSFTRRDKNMKDNLFAELMQAAAEASEYAAGKRDLRTTVLPLAPEPMNSLEIKRLRQRLNASQAVFAKCLNVSTKLVQAWESHRRAPEGAALRLLRISEQFPNIIFAAETARASPKSKTQLLAGRPQLQAQTPPSGRQHIQAKRPSSFQHVQVDRTASERRSAAQKKTTRAAS